MLSLLSHKFTSLNERYHQVHGKISLKIVLIPVNISTPLLKQLIFGYTIGIWIFLKVLCGVGHDIPLPDLVLDIF
jgi:hypothetical protein